MCYTLHERLHARMFDLGLWRRNLFLSVYSSGLHATKEPALFAERTQADLTLGISRTHSHARLLIYKYLPSGLDFDFN